MALPNLGDERFIRFDYLATFIELPNPQLGNTFLSDRKRVANRVRGGALKTVKLASHPKVEALNYSFNTLKRTHIDAWNIFVKGSLGQIVTLTDWELTVWEGVILAPDNQYTTTREHLVDEGLPTEFENEAYSLQITFTGNPL